MTDLLLSVQILLDSKFNRSSLQRCLHRVCFKIVRIVRTGSARSFLCVLEEQSV